MEIRTYKCDVKDCHLQLGVSSGSAITATVKNPVGWGGNAITRPDLCSFHLQEFWDWFEKRGITFDADV